MINPYITEKTIKLAKDGIFTLIVDGQTNKLAGIKSLTDLHKVQVESANIINVKGRKRRFRQSMGKTKAFKKLIIKLKKGQKIPGFEIVEEDKNAKKA